MADPLSSPQVVSVEAVLAIGELESAIDVVADDVHPAASVTVTVYVPLANPETLAFVEPFDHAYVYGDVPFVADAVALPLSSPHVVSVEVVLAIGELESPITAVDAEVHPAASVTVTVYVPGANPVIDAVESPFDHEYI